MGSEPKDDSFAALFESQAEKPRRARALHVGDKVEGAVVQVGKDTVFVELDDKQQAFFDAAELRTPEGEMTVKEGDRVAARVVELDQAQGIVRLGRSFGKPGSLAAIEQAKAAQLPVEGKVTGINKGGLEIDLGGGARAFCPISQADAKYLEDPKSLGGPSLRFLVTDVRDGGRNVVVSRRALLQREASEAAEKIAHTLTVGAVVRGTITGVRDFGAFVDLGGIEGMIPRSEIAHDRGVNVADAVKPGETVEVQIREIKEAPPTRPGAPTKKITLSLKALAPAPAAPPPGKEIAIGSIAKGVVERIETYGIFVQLEGTKGRAGRGLVPNQELGVPRGTDVRKAFPEGTTVTVKVLETGEGRLRLSIKGAKDDEERAHFEEARGKAGAPASLGTFADLLRKKR